MAIRPFTSGRNAAAVVAIAGASIGISSGLANAGAFEPEDDPRLQVRVSRAADSVQASIGSYHCLPPRQEGGFQICHDRSPEPLPLRGRLQVRGCADFKVHLGYPAEELRATVLSRSGKRVRTIRPPVPLKESNKHFRFRMPGLPARSERIALFVVHEDGNRGDFEAGIRRRPNRC